MLELTGLYEEEPESLEMRHTSVKVLLERAEALISFRLQERGNRYWKSAWQMMHCVMIWMKI